MEFFAYNDYFTLILIKNALFCVKNETIHKDGKIEIDKADAVKSASRQNNPFSTYKLYDITESF